MTFPYYTTTYYTTTSNSTNTINVPYYSTAGTCYFTTSNSLTWNTTPITFTYYPQYGSITGTSINLIFSYYNATCQWCKVSYSLSQSYTVGAQGYICPSCCRIIKPFLGDMGFLLSDDCDLVGRVFNLDDPMGKEVARLEGERCPQCQDLHL
jgi:hypothetical protein